MDLRLYEFEQFVELVECLPAEIITRGFIVGTIDIAAPVVTIASVALVDQSGYFGCISSTAD